MRKVLLFTTALAAGILTAGAGSAQQQGQGQTATQGQAQDQGGLPGQRLAQEQSQEQGTILHISPAGVRQIQQALNQKGYDPGNVDGQWSQSTQQAARNFQQAQGLEPTGQLNAETLAALDLTGILTGQQAQTGGQAGQAQGGLPGQQLGQEQAGGQGGGQQQGQGGQQQAQAGGQQGAGAQLYVSPASIRQIQQALNQAGYDAGNIDGQWGQRTQNAARNFQQAQGLEPTGSLNVRTIAALGLNNILTGQGMAQGSQGQGGLPGQQLAQEQAQNQGEPLHLSPASIRQIQQALNQAGYDPGNVDGTWQQETQQAIRNFQQAQGLEPTGSLNTYTVAALGMSDLLTGAGATAGAATQGGVGATGQAPSAGGAAGGSGGGATMQPPSGQQ